MPSYVLQEALYPLQNCNAMDLRILHSVLHIENFNLRWVSHFLDSDQKPKE
jgi:hypothetical protein